MERYNNLSRARGQVEVPGTTDAEKLQHVINKLRNAGFKVELKFDSNSLGYYTVDGKKSSSEKLFELYEETQRRVK